MTENENTEQNNQPASQPVLPLGPGLANRPENPLDTLD
jgi:hypothetical protein